MIRTQIQKYTKKVKEVVPRFRCAFGRNGAVCLLAGVGILFFHCQTNYLCAEVGNPSGFYGASENDANILPGTFSPEGNFSNASVAQSGTNAGTGSQSNAAPSNLSQSNVSQSNVSQSGLNYQIPANQPQPAGNGGNLPDSISLDGGDSSWNGGQTASGTQSGISPAETTPGDLLHSRTANSPGSDELLSGNRNSEVLPETAAMEIAPMDSQVGASAEAILTSGGQSEESLPTSGAGTGTGTDTGAGASETPAVLGTDASLGAVSGAGNGKISRMTRGDEHEGKTVLDVQIIGNLRHTTEKILQQIHMRPGHPFKAANLDDDILRLNQSRLFTLVEPYIQMSKDGVTVIFNVQERPVMRYLRFQGNGSIRIGTLEKECGLVPGRPFSPYDVEEGRKKIEVYYRSKGFERVSVRTIQGEKIGDPGVIYLINPGPKLRIGHTEFIGNTIASDARLKTIIQSKPGPFWVFRGELRDELLQEDIRRLEDYYRRLGFFYARIGRRVKRTSEKGWNDVTFVIDEGPQAHIREIRYVGNATFNSDILLEDMKIHQGKPFNKDRLDMSITRVRKRYGREGYVFADINAEMKILDDLNLCDIVFAISEGKTYRVGRVNVLIEGEYPHTQVSTVLNRLSVKPGDLVNVYELQQSERRLKASQLFANDAAQGKMPKIVYSPPETPLEAEVAAQIGSDANAVGGSGTTEHRKASDGSAGSAGTSSGSASIGGGAGRDALSGGNSHSVRKVTIADVDESFTLAENEAFLDVNIHTILRPIESESEGDGEEHDRSNDGNAEGTEMLSGADSEALKKAESSAEIQMEKVWCMELVDRETGKCCRTYEFPEEDADLYLGGKVCVTNDDPAYGDFPETVCESERPLIHEVRYAPSTQSAESHNAFPKPAAAQQELEVQGYGTSGYAPYAASGNPGNSGSSGSSGVAGTSAAVPLQRIPVVDELPENENWNASSDSEAAWSVPAGTVVRGSNPETGTTVNYPTSQTPQANVSAGNASTGNVYSDTVPSGAGQPGAVQSGAVQSSVGQSGTGDSRTVQSGTGTAGTADTSNAPSWASSDVAGAAPAAQIETINPRTGQQMAPPAQPGISNTDETPFTRPIGDVPEDGYSLGDWQRQSLPITVQTEETTTGRIMFSVGVSSDSGLVGSVVVDEQNFDIRRWPTTWGEIKNGTCWRGRGQHFRMELMPGTETSRYVVSFDEPYLFNSQIGLGTSAMYYERDYSEWDERRVGGQFNFSRALTYDMRAYIGFRGYEVLLRRPITPTPDRISEALGHSNLFGFSFRLVHDRRDSSFLATEGYFASIELEQVIGTWSYPRFNAQFKKYWLLYERADMSGRHVLSFTSSFSWTGKNTPVYESYFAGGSSTIRGFEFRGVSPRDLGAAIGGNVMVLASLEYLFPITADDMIRGVIFCDTGTVQPSLDNWDDDYRVSIGAGLRISMPALGPAPMALDFAVPLVKQDGDEKQLFSFQMGLQR